VFVDCGCNGFHAGTGDKLQAGVTVTLLISGARCTASTQTQTSSSGTVSFIGIPGGCTYTLSVSGLNLCSNSASSQSVPAGGEVNFAIQGTASSLVIPPSTTVLCGSDTSPASTGVATIASGTCAGAAASFTDTFTVPRCPRCGRALHSKGTPLKNSDSALAASLARCVALAPSTTPALASSKLGVDSSKSAWVMVVVWSSE